MSNDNDDINELAKKLIIGQIETCLNELGNKVLRRVVKSDDELALFSENPFAYMADISDELADRFDEIENSLTDEEKQQLKDEAKRCLDEYLLEDHSDSNDDDEDDDIIKH